MWGYSANVKAGNARVELKADVFDYEQESELRRTIFANESLAQIWESQSRRLKSFYGVIDSVDCISGWARTPVEVESLCGEFPKALQSLNFGNLKKKMKRFRNGAIWAIIFNRRAILRIANGVANL